MPAKKKNRRKWIVFAVLLVVVGGVFAAAQDENTFMFSGWKGANELALEIKNYIERRVQEMRAPHSATHSSVADELQKLAALKAQGVLSDIEFQAAKKRLLS